MLIGVPLVRFSLGYGTLVQLVCIPFGVWCIWQAFFEDRLDGDQPPSRVEKGFAVVWLWLRRLVVGTVAFVFLGLAIHGAQSFKSGDLPGILIAAVLGLFALSIALFGGGRSRSVSDDLDIYRKRRDRYK
ncbi:MAG TPA: hypothetical protein PKN13_08065 [Accumulibacter sp.]|nr:hypothetical protein [Accumulibacter sp.]HMW18288.1 hypothetical protein [Accumulibacter sp.]HMX22640.1 hypothetical protein [Accumulibacter sp.]HMY06515.1 hypothetical protein [Accumulibacter sp.]HNC18050.1 hypothetical protein [Accumulibacter sp.]